MTEQANQAYRDLIEHIRQAELLGATQSVLGWDQETMMPPGSGAAAYRARQEAQLAGLVHERVVDPRVGEWLAACEQDETLTADPLSPAAVNVRELRRDYDRRTRLPQKLVEQFSETVSMARHAWKRARREDDFSLFQNELEQVVALNRQRAACFGYGDDEETWDALAEDFEPGMRAADVERVFEPLRTELTDLVQKLTEQGKAPAPVLSNTPLPIASQRKFVAAVAERLGFDFERGRLDESTHPFCSGFHRDDVRMTTRFRETDLLDGLSSTLHESGHGLYEQGLPGDAEVADTPFASAVSLGIHESQSRMIENQVGRSRAFWRWCRGELVKAFGGTAEIPSAEALYRGMNIVQPSLIRVEADEATYNLHIMIRFDLERAMIRGDLAVADLPGAWNEAYERYLGVKVPSNAEGCLQDVHWSLGAIGYFPTYTLGNLYSAQFFEAMQQELGDLDAAMAEGNFAPIVGWLREKIHQHGRRYRAGELCEVVTGRKLEAAPLLRHLRGKFEAVYGL